MRLRSAALASAVFAAGMSVGLALPALAETVKVRVFTDVDVQSEVGAAVQRLAGLGVFFGYGDGRFLPNRAVTRGELAVTLHRFEQRVIEPLREQIEELRRKTGLGVCGDGKVQGGEQCDDGNTKSGDGCSAACLKESGSGAKKCFSSRDCGSTQYCSTEDGDCFPACEPWAAVCIEVCTGVCKAKKPASAGSRPRGR